MLVTTLRIQQKRWNQHLSNLSSQWQFQDICIYRGYHIPCKKNFDFASIKSDAFGIGEKTRDAASNIRKAVQAKDYSKAIESTYSMLDYTNKMRWSSNPNRRFPSRLVAHSLVHALLRQGQIMEAASELERIMSLGVTFHHQTMQKSISLLCSMPSAAKADQLSRSHQVINRVYPGDSESGFLLSALHSRLPPATRLAASLLITGRRYRQKRTEEMFDKLIDACLLHGEIVIATLLFVLLVKDWQLRSVARASATKVEALINDTEVQERHVELSFPTPLFTKTLALHRLRIPYPESAILQKILESIKYHGAFVNIPAEPRLASLESLAMLANLVEDGSLPYGNISSLLCTIQSCPREAKHHLITIRHQGQVQNLSIYQYAHSVLVNLCHNLPSQTSKKADFLNPRMLSCLDLRSYNTLLQYVLRHHSSPSMANQILEHMLFQRKPPLKPDVVTYNILLRSASLLGRNDITYTVLERLRETLCISGDSSSHVPKLMSIVKHPRRNLPKQIATEMLSVPSHKDLSSISVNNYTLSSYITHLVSTSQLDLMIQVLMELFPILAYAPGLWRKYPSVLQQSVSRAVSCGPYILAAFLNGCRKSGKTGLTERLWLLSKEAELASWIPPADAQTHAPWCLSIQAYTSVMQCYANEAKKGLNAIRGDRRLSLPQEAYYRNVSRMNRARHIVRGWARFIANLQEEEIFSDSLRHETSKRMAWYLCKTMFNSALSMSRVLAEHGLQMKDISFEWRAQLERLEWPIPDARFFNALLDIFGRCSGMQYRRRALSKRSWSRRTLRIALEKYSRGQSETSVYDFRLVEIANVLANYGYALPVGFRRVLIGRQPVIIKRDIVRKQSIILGVNRPVRIVFNPFALPVVKTRGLAFGRRNKMRRRRRGDRCN